MHRLTVQIPAKQRAVYGRLQEANGYEATACGPRLQRAKI